MKAPAAIAGSAANVALREKRNGRKERQLLPAVVDYSQMRSAAVTEQAARRRISALAVFKRYFAVDQN